MSAALHSNELRDFANRAPKRFQFDGARMVCCERIRGRWLDEMHSGSIDERINRRAGLKVHQPPPYAPWRGVRAAIMRHVRRTLQKQGFRSVCHAYRVC